MWTWKRAIVDRLARLRLIMHEPAAQVTPVSHGIPWLGFVVYPTHRRVKARAVRSTTRRLRARLDHYRAGRITFGELDASVQGWINHVRYADSWRLRERVLGQGLVFRKPAPKTFREDCGSGAVQEPNGIGNRR